MAESFEDVFQPGQRSNLSRTTSRRRLLVGLANHTCVGGDPDVEVTVEVVTLWQPALLTSNAQEGKSSPLNYY